VYSTKIDKAHCADNINCIYCNSKWIYVNDAGIRQCQDCNTSFTWRDETKGKELFEWLDKYKG